MISPSVSSQSTACIKRQNVLFKLKSCCGVACVNQDTKLYHQINAMLENDNRVPNFMIST